MTRLTAGEVHVDEALEGGGAVDAGEVGLQEVVDGGAGDGVAVDGERLHDVLRGGVEAAEGFADEVADDVLGEHARRVIKDFAQRGVAVGREDGEEGFEGAGVSARALARLAEQFVGRVFEADFAVGVHLAEDVLGVGALQPLVEVGAALAAGLDEREVLRREARREDDLDGVVREVEQGAQSLVEFRVADGERLRVHHVLEVVEQHDRAPVSEV